MICLIGLDLKIAFGRIKYYNVRIIIYYTHCIRNVIKSYTI